MKKMKKLTSILLALVMALGLMTTALATGDGSDEGSAESNSPAATGTITINKAVVGQTYDIYRMFDLESYDEDNGNYSYKVTKGWEGFFKPGEAGVKYITLDDNGYILSTTFPDNDNGAAAATFAQAALKWAKDGGIASSGSITATAPKDDLDAKTTSIVFDGLPLGYYLIDSSLGAACMLDTTNLNATVNEKNDEPSIDKDVQVGTTLGPDGNEYPNWTESNTASIGDTVNFKITIQAKVGAENYVLHDEMSEGLTFDADSIKVLVDDKELDEKNYKITVKSTSGNNPLTDDCDFEIEFTKDYLDSLTRDTDIVVTYSATLNENAVITGTSTNKAELGYGDKHTTTTTTTETKTFEFDLVKTDSNDELLDGAKFELYDVEENGEPIQLVAVFDNDGKIDYYRVATEAEAEAEGFQSAVIEAGKATIKGLGNGTYWLEETEAPTGYHKLTERVKVEIKGSNNTTKLIEEQNTLKYDVINKGGIQVINKTGTELPETGGIGTTIFYVVGGVLVVAAVVLLVTKKRMGAKD